MSRLIASFVLFTSMAPKVSMLPKTHNINQLFNLSDKSGNENSPDYGLHLFKCPGSTIPGQNTETQNLTEFFRKYGLQEESVQGKNLQFIARISEKEPECLPTSIFPSIKSSTVNNKTVDQGHIMLPHGWILKYYTPKYWESIPPNKYCIETLDEDNQFMIKYCGSDCLVQPCISKCCFAHEVCDLGSSDEECHCTDSGAYKWTTTANELTESSYSFVHHLNDDCAYGHFALHNNSVNINSSFQNHFQILKNGSVIFNRMSDGNWISLPEGKYCVDGAGQSIASEMGTADFSGETDDMVLYVCRSEDDVVYIDQNNQEEFISSRAFTLLVPFATVFIILTIIVHILTWKEQNVHGYTFFFYLVTLLALYVFVVLGNIRSIIHPDSHPSICAFIAGAIHFSYLSSACWVTCVSYDVWRTFKKINKVTVKSKGKRRFIIFSAFSLGYPLMQVCFCAILDMVYRDTPADEISVILPGYGRSVCNMSNDGVTYYLYMPIGVLLLCNMGFFVATIISMIHYKKSIREAFAELSRTANPSKANQSFGIYARLFIIMGIFWISQIISWFVLLNDSSNTSQTWEIVFAITDALTVLQAVAIFYIFVCKKSVFSNLWIIHPWLRPFLSLWIKYGCCQSPSNASNATSKRKGSLKIRKGSGDNNASSRNSGDSNGIIPKVEPAERDEARQTSFNSDITVISEIEHGKITSASTSSGNSEIKIDREILDTSV